MCPNLVPILEPTMTRTCGAAKGQRMEEHVGDPDSTHTDEEAGDGAPSDYLESLRARFDELASRIEAATQESLDRTNSLLTDSEAENQAEDAAPHPLAVEADEPAPETATAATETTDIATPDTEPAPEAASQTPIRPPPIVHREPQPEPEPPTELAEPETEASPTAAPGAATPQSAAAASAADEGHVADDTDLDTWDETAPPAEPAKGPRTRSSQPAAASDDLSDPQTLGAQLRSRMRPAADKHPRRKMLVRVLIVVVLALVAFVVGRWWALSNQSTTPVDTGNEQVAPTTSSGELGETGATPQAEATPAGAAQAAATQALIDGDLATVTVTVDDGTAILTGSVESDEAKAAAAAAVGSVAGVNTVDNRLVVEPPPPPDPAEVPAAAELARDDAGFGHLGVTVIDGTATITGVVPLDELDGGFFAYTAPLREALLAVNGIDAVRTRLQLSGEAASLSRDLDALFETTPIAFAAGSAALTPDDELVLDQAAIIIADNPGLRVIVAGHPDPTGAAATNAALALERANAVVLYLATDGVPAARLIAASGPETSVRVVFEVAP